VLLLGVGLESFTLMHAFEEWAGVPWLFNRLEQLWAITDERERVAVPSRRHTDDPRYEARDYPSLEPVLREYGAISYGSVGAAAVRLVSARLAAECLIPLISANPDVVLGKGGTCPATVGEATLAEE
jgi:aminoglycoside N3'-acetyltransferase